MSCRATSVFLGTAFVLATAYGLSACQAGADPGALVDGGDKYLNHGSDAMYVGAEMCGSCHGEQYKTFMQSQMGRSFRKATLTNSDADFANAPALYDADADLFYQPYSRGEGLFVKEYRLAGSDTVYARTEQIDYIIGSGHHTNSHMREENGYVYQVPVTWYVEEQRWDLAPGFTGGTGQRFSRPIPEACMTCHNGMPDFVEGSENKFAHIPEGIDCERCHGPGSIHVEQRQLGKVDTTAEIDYTIVNPGKLSAELQLNICESCHTQGAAIYKDGHSPRDFRPGMPISAISRVFLIRDADSTRNFVMASHPDRLRMSACFQGTREADSSSEPMTCITCHNPHLPVGDLDYNISCQTCHEKPDLADCSDPTVVANGGIGDCVTCHMPTSGTIDIPHVTVTDHYIRKPDGLVRGPTLPDDQVEETMKMVRLASLLDVPTSDLDYANGLMSYFEEITSRPELLDSTAVRLDRARGEEPASDVMAALIRLRFLQKDYAAVRALAEEGDLESADAWTRYRVGEAYSAAGRFDAALVQLKWAVDLAPYHLRFRRKMATVTSDTGQLSPALAAFDALLNEDPTFEEVHNNRGFVYLQLGNMDAAEQDFLAELQLNPNAEMALANLASLYFNTGRADEARPYAERLIRRAPDNPDYQRLIDALRTAGV